MTDKKICVMQNDDSVHLKEHFLALTYDYFGAAMCSCRKIFSCDLDVKGPCYIFNEYHSSTRAKQALQNETHQYQAHQ